jgi:hypothetical protein
MMRSYIFPQFSAHRRVRVALDMELDATVPFDETWLECYMGFVRLWQGSLGWLHLRFGDRALPEMEGFITGLESLFLEAPGSSPYGIRPCPGVPVLDFAWIPSSSMRSIGTPSVSLPCT